VNGLKAEREKSSIQLEIDPEKAEKYKARRQYRLHVVEIPALRLLGFGFICFFVFLHNRYIQNHFSWQDFGSLLIIVSSYTLLSWLALFCLFEKVRRVHLGVFFLAADIVIFVLFIYHTGGEKSLLFFLLMARIADQANAGFKRALLLSHLSVIGYILLILYLFYFEERAISFTTEAAKTCFIYFTNIYLSFTARTSDLIKSKTRASLEFARKLIVELKEKSLQLEKSRKKAETADRAKSQFLANMSHELRTPLNHIIGFTELVVDGRFGHLTKIQGEYLSDVLQSSRHLLSLINDILDLSKVEAGKLDLRPADVEIKDLLENSLAMIKEKAMKHGIRIFLNTGNIPDRIRADERMLKQILYNLLSNAAKFTKDGGSIQLTARRVSEGNGILHSEDSGAFVEITVADTGIGILAKDLDRIFETFEQVDSSAGREYKGTGLGLSLTRKLVELHGGRIWAESQGEGMGSTFRFIIPVTAAEVLPETDDRAISI
jgi:signal transduction histidine kinase